MMPGSENTSFTLGEIKGQLSQVITQLGVMDTRITTMFADMESRVRTVEGRQHWYAGVAAAISAGATYLVQTLWKH